MASDQFWARWVSHYLNRNWMVFILLEFCSCWFMDSVLWAASIFIFNAVVTCWKYCVLTSAGCYCVCSCWNCSQQVVMGQRRMLVGKKLVVWCWVTAGAGTIVVGVFGMSSVALLCLSCAVMLVLIFSKPKACEVVCTAPLAHQGRLQHDRRHQIKRQAWHEVQLQ